MKRIVIAAVIAGAGLAGAAWAQQQNASREKEILGGKNAREILAPAPSLSADACRQLANYQPKKDGDAEYKPGVDVNGKPVVEADLGGNAIPVPDTVRFHLSVDMAEYLGLAGNGPNPAGYVDFGEVEIDRDGSVYLDGRPMESQQEAALRALCDEQKQP